MTAVTQAFEDHVHEMSASDWELLVKMQRTHRDDEWCLLFFFMDADVQQWALSKKMLQLESEIQAMPFMKEFSIDDVIFKNRHSEFLSAFDDKSYCQIFQFLHMTSDFIFSFWQTFSQLDSMIFKILTLLLWHVLLWYAPEWVFPEQADNNRRDFQWVAEVTRVVLQESKLSNDNRHGYEKTDNIHAIGEELVKQVWIMIENDEIWHDAHVQAEVSWNLLKSVWPHC